MPRDTPAPARPRSVRGRRPRPRSRAPARSRSSPRGSRSRRTSSSGTPSPSGSSTTPCPQPTSATVRALLELLDHAVERRQPGRRAGSRCSRAGRTARSPRRRRGCARASRRPSPLLSGLGDPRRVEHRAERDLEEAGQVGRAVGVGQRDRLLGRQRVAAARPGRTRRSRRPPGRSATRARSALPCRCARRAPPASAGRRRPSPGRGRAGRPSRRAPCSGSRRPRPRPGRRTPSASPCRAVPVRSLPFRPPSVGFRPNVGAAAGRSPRVAPLVLASIASRGASYNRPMLLGRDRERQAREGARRRPRWPSAVLALLGEAGIGKTTLLDIRRRAGAGRGDAGPAGTRDRVRGAGAVRRAARAAPAGAALARPDPRAAGGPRSTGRLRCGRRPRRTASPSAPRRSACSRPHAEDAPVAAFVDDAHWLDGSSADALLFAIRRLVADPIAVVLAVREGEPSFVDGAGPPDAPRSAGSTATRPPQLVGDGPRSAGCYAATAGNPLALLELAPEARTAGATLPSTRRCRSSAQRRAGLRPAGRIAARGDARVLSCSLPPATRATCGARARRVPGCRRRARSRPRPPASSRSGRVASSSATRLPARPSTAPPPPEERRAAHRALAGALPDRDADRRAWHLALAAVGPDEAASSALEQAGDRARERSAYAVAAAAYERAARAVALEPARRCSTRPPTPPGSPGQAERASRCWTSAVPGEARPVARARRSTICAARSRRGAVRCTEAQSILAEAAERAAALRSRARGRDARGGAMQSLLRGRRPGDGADGRACDASWRPGSAAARRSSPVSPAGMALVFAGEGEAGARALQRRSRAARVLRRAPRRSRTSSSGRHTGRSGCARRRPEGACTSARWRSCAAERPWVRCPNCSCTSHATGRRRDDWPAAHAGYDEAIALARETGQGVALAFGLAGLAWLEAREGPGGGVPCTRGGGPRGVHPGGRGDARAVGGGGARRSRARPRPARGRARALPGMGRAPRGARDRGRGPLASARARGDATSGWAAATTRLPRPRSTQRARRRRDSPGRSHARPAPRPAGDRRGLRAGVRSGGRPARRNARRLRDGADPSRLRRRACAARAGASARARSSGRRSTPSTRSAPNRGRTSPASSSRRRGRPRGRRDPSTLDELTPQELQIALLLAGRPNDPRGSGRDVPQPEDDRVPPAERLPEARHSLPLGAGGGGRAPAPLTPELTAVLGRPWCPGRPGGAGGAAQGFVNRGTGRLHRVGGVDRRPRTGGRRGRGARVDSGRRNARPRGGASPARSPPSTPT